MQNHFGMTPTTKPPKTVCFEDSEPKRAEEDEILHIDLGEEDSSKDSANVLVDYVSSTMTIWQAFLDISSKYAHSIAFNIGHKRQWQSFTWGYYKEQAMAFANSLMAMGMEKEEAVLMIGSNSPELYFANMGSIAAGGVVIHERKDRCTSELIEIICHSNTSILVVEDVEAIASLQAVCSQLRVIIVINYSSSQDHDHFDEALQVEVIPYHQFLKIGKDDDDVEMQTLVRVAGMQSSDCCVLHYQYNASGDLDGVMISHDNLYFTASKANVSFGCLSNADRILGYLPIHHVFSQIVEIYLPIISGALVYFCCSGNPSNPLPLIVSMQEMKPTIFFAPPSVWEQITVKVFKEQSKSLSKPYPKAIHKWAKARAKSNSLKLQFDMLQKKRRAHHSLGHFLAESLVFSSLKATLGLCKCARGCYAVLAPLNIEILDIFVSIDIPIYQISGMSETVGFSTVNAIGNWGYGSYGRELKGTHMYVNPSTQEVLHCGRNIFLGYKDNSFLTSSVMIKAKVGSNPTPILWFRSGLMGHLNPYGFLCANDYLSDFLILSSGDVVPPIPFEKCVLKELPEVKRALVIGDRRIYMSVLLILRTKVPSKSKKKTSTAKSVNKSRNLLVDDAVARSHELGSKAVTVPEVLKCPHWTKYFDRGIERTNKKMRLSSHKIRKWLVLVDDFSIEKGELVEQGVFPKTTYEPRRAVIQRLHKTLIDTLYDVQYV